MFSTVKDVREALTPGGASNDTSTAASLQANQLEDAIREADGTVVQHLRGYSPPDPVPAIIRAWSRNIAAYLATLTFNRGRDVGENDPVRLRYESTMTALRAVQSGVAPIPFDTNPAPGESGDGGTEVYNTYTGSLFHAEDLLGPPVSVPRYHIWPGQGYYGG